MSLGERVSILFRIFLPALFLVLLNVSPVSQRVAEAWQKVYSARRDEHLRDAASGLREVIAYEPWRTELWEQVGQAELAAGRISEAVEALRQAEAVRALSDEGRIQLGEGYEQLGQDAAAEAHWQSLLRDSSPPAQVYERLVNLQRKRGDLENAAATLRAWYESEPENARPAFLLGLYLSAMHPDEALLPLLQASRSDRSYTSAVQTLREALGISANYDHSAYGRLMIGRALGRLGQWDLAAESFNEALAHSPEYADAWAFLGEANHHLGKGGKTELDLANQLEPESPLVRAMLSLYWRRHGQPEKALVYLEAIARQEPEEPVWEVEIGNTLVEKGDLPAARARFERAVEMAPRDALYWQHLANFSIENGVDVRSLGLEAARNAVLLSPNDAGALDMMGWALLSLGDLASAERFLQQSLGKDPTYSLTLLHLGQLYLQQQDNQQARIFLKRAAGQAGEDAVGVIARRLLQQYFGEGG